MSSIVLNKDFIKNHIDKNLEKYKSDKLIDLNKIEKFYKKILSYIKNLSKAKYVQFTMAFSKHKFDDNKVRLLKALFSIFDNNAKNTNLNKNNNISNKFKKFEPKIEGNYKCFGDYKVINQLGSGAYGTVYLVEKNNKKYAIKNQFINFNDVWMTKNQHLKQIKNEIDISILMGKKNIGPKIYDYYICPIDMNRTSVLIVMEWMTEGSLSNWLLNNTLTKAHQKQINEKLEKLHKEKIVHSDLRDDNIFVTKKGSKIEFYIGDFGLSKTIEQLLEEHKSFDKSAIKHIYGNNFMLHHYVAKLFILCNII